MSFVDPDRLDAAKALCQTLDAVHTAPAEVIAALADLLDPAEVRAHVAFCVVGSSTVSWEVTWTSERALVHVVATATGRNYWHLGDSAHAKLEGIVAVLYRLDEVRSVNVDSVDADTRAGKWHAVTKHSLSLRDGRTIKLPPAGQTSPSWHGNEADDLLTQLRAELAGGA